MSETGTLLECRRCGGAFILTSDYVSFLRKRGKREVTPLLCLTCFWKNGQVPKEYGQIKWFNARKHCGFIETERGEEIFFHQNQFIGADRRKLVEGQPVRFHVRGMVKGQKALNVELAPV
ncbi:MAG: cold shock domain-containing protein [Anaerolineae bacterium]|nr:cold shock domain-containing protein [Anaerolineae bacterium]